MLPLTDTQINDALGPYGVRATTDLTAGIKTYIELLLKWNRSVSLTTVIGVDGILRFHFGESLFALPMLPVEKSRLADVGSGAGFPDSSRHGKTFPRCHVDRAKREEICISQRGDSPARP